MFWVFDEFLVLHGYIRLFVNDVIFILIRYLCCDMERSCCTYPVWSVLILYDIVPIWLHKAV